MDSVSKLAYSNRLRAPDVLPKLAANTPPAQGTGVQRGRKAAITGEPNAETLASGTAGD